LGTLTRLGVQAGEVDPALVAALHSKAPAQRAAGAMLVGWAGGPEQRLAVKKLLQDSDGTVRFHAAQGILAGRDKAAVPVPTRQKPWIFWRKTRILRIKLSDRPVN